MLNDPHSGARTVLGMHLLVRQIAYTIEMQSPFSNLITPTLNNPKEKHVIGNNLKTTQWKPITNPQENLIRFQY